MAAQIPFEDPTYTHAFKLLTALESYHSDPKLSAWERDWLLRQGKRLEMWGTVVFISYPEADILSKLTRKISISVMPTAANDNNPE